MIQDDKTDQALRFLAITIKLDSLNIDHYKLMLDCYRKRNSEEDILRVSQVIDRRFGHDPQGQMIAGATYMQIGHHDKGGKCLERAYELDRKDIMIVLNYGNYLLLTRDFEKAVGVLEQALETDNTRFIIHYNLARAHFMNGARDKAMLYFNSATTLAKTEADRQKLQTLQKMFTQPIK